MELAEDEIEAMLEGLGELEADLLNDYEVLNLRLFEFIHI
jgi:hypothetical protein